MKPLTLGEFLEAVDNFDSGDAEHYALTEALRACYERLDDDSGTEVQAIFPILLKEAEKVCY